MAAAGPAPIIIYDGAQAHFASSGAATLTAIRRRRLRAPLRRSCQHAQHTAHLVSTPSSFTQQIFIEAGRLRSHIARAPHCI